MLSASGTYKISVRRSNELPQSASPLRDDESVFYSRGALNAEDSLDTMNPLQNVNNLPIKQEPSRISIVSAVNPFGLHPHPLHAPVIDHEFGFEVLKLNKAQAVKVA